MTAHPGKKLMFMGGEFGQWHEWRDYEDLAWAALAHPHHRQLQDWNRALNRLYREYPELHASEHTWEGFRWIEADNATKACSRFCASACPAKAARSSSSRSTARRCRATATCSACRSAGRYRKILDSDAPAFGGSGYSQQTRGRSGARGLARFPSAHPRDSAAARDGRSGRATVSGVTAELANGTSALRDPLLLSSRSHTSPLHANERTFPPTSAHASTAARLTRTARRDLDRRGREFRRVLQRRDAASSCACSMRAASTSCSGSRCRSAPRISGTASCRRRTACPGSCTACACTGRTIRRTACATTRNKLLLDPYARALAGKFTWHSALLGYAPDADRGAPIPPTARLTTTRRASSTAHSTGATTARPRCRGATPSSTSCTSKASRSCIRTCRSASAARTSASRIPQSSPI